MRDLDAVVAAAKKAGAPIVTRSGTPVTITTPTGKSRAIVLRDNDGFMVRVVEVPATLPGMVQPGASMAVAVKDMDETAKFYHDVVGIDLAGDKTVEAGRGDGGSGRRAGEEPVPHDVVRVPRHEVRADGVLRVEGRVRTTVFHLRVPDPGASGWVARVSNIDAMMKEVNARHTPKLTPGPVWFSEDDLRHLHHGSERDEPRAVPERPGAETDQLIMLVRFVRTCVTGRFWRRRCSPLVVARVV